MSYAFERNSTKKIQIKMKHKFCYISILLKVGNSKYFGKFQQTKLTKFHGR